MKIHQGGFTLLEALIVLAIAAVLAVLAAAPSVILTSKTQFETDKVQLKNILQVARNYARVKQECVTVNIAAQLVTVTAYTMAAPCVAPFVGPDPLGPAPSLFDPSVTLTPFNIPVTGAVNPLVFNQQGGTDYKQVATMTISAKGSTENVLVLPLIGQIVEQE